MCKIVQQVHTSRYITLQLLRTGTVIPVLLRQQDDATGGPIGAPRYVTAKYKLMTLIPSS